MAVATGIEISGNTLRCVVLQGSAKAPKLKTVFCESLEPAQEEEENSSEGAARRFSEILKEKGVPTGNVVLALDGRQVYCREVVVPFMRSDQIQKTIKFEAEEFMPAAPVESMIVDHYKVAEIDSKSRILVCGVQKSLIAQTLEFCKTAGLVPRALDLDSACLANAAFFAGAFRAPQVEGNETGEESTAHITAVALDVAPDVTRLVLVEDGRLRRVRTFTVAIDPQNPAPESVRKITREIRRTEASCSLAASVSVTYLTGPAYSLNLGVMMREILGMDIKLLELQSIAGSEEEDDLRTLREGGSIALGAALKGLGVDNVAFDFRKEEFAYRKAFDELKVGLMCTACLAFFMAFLLAYTFNLRLSQHRFALRKIREDAKRAYLERLPRSVGEPPLRTKNTVATLSAFATELERRRSGHRSGKGQDIVSALDIFKEFGEAVNNAKARNAKDKFDFRLTKCTITQSSVRMEGIIKEDSNSDDIKREILKHSQYLGFPDSETKTVKGEIVVMHRYKVKTEKRK
jgi:hypothetical protein